MKTIKVLDRDKTLLVLIVVTGLVLSFALRYSLRKYKSTDYDAFDKRWFISVIRKGPVRVLRNNPTDYTPFYTYLMIAASYLFREVPKQAALKFVIIPFDYLCAFFVYKTVKLKYPSGYVPLFVFFAVLFLPTVFLLSSAWGQKDFIYIAFLSGCLYFLLRKREVWAFIFFGLAFSFKLQAMFLFPLLLILWLRRYVSWKSFFIIPLTYLVMITPAWLAGRPLKDLLTIYFRQAATYEYLVLNAPTLYQWFSGNLNIYFILPGLIFAASVVFLFCAAAYLSKVTINREVIISLGLISVLIVPYFLPMMHDRYFLPADFMALVFAFYFPRYFFVPIAVSTVSFFSFFPFLLGYETVPFKNLATLLALVIIFVVYHFARLVLGQRSEREALTTSKVGLNP